MVNMESVFKMNGRIIKKPKSVRKVKKYLKTINPVVRYAKHLGVFFVENEGGTKTRTLL